MQTIIRTNRNVHPILNDLDVFYTKVSEREYKNTSLIEKSFYEPLKSLETMFNDYLDTNFSFTYKKIDFSKLDLPVYDKKNLILCFSGGKDSIAALLHYKKLGYNVYLYHLRHINFAQTDEYENALKIADYLNVPIFVDDIKLSGHNDYTEHPMKNIIIANGALSYGIREGITTKIAFGNYYSSSLAYDRFDFCGGDCKEMWQSYEQIIHTIIPRFKVYVCLRNLGTTLKSVCKDRTLLDMSVSCLGRANLRDYRSKWVNSKFNITLPKHRCGSCYKCCIEYIYMTDHNLQDYNEKYYSYCLRQLQKNTQKEIGIKPDITYLWNMYFFYDISKSKYLNSSNFNI